LTAGLMASHRSFASHCSARPEGAKTPPRELRRSATPRPLPRELRSPSPRPNDAQIARSSQPVRDKQGCPRRSLSRALSSRKLQTLEGDQSELLNGACKLSGTVKFGGDCILSTDEAQFTPVKWQRRTSGETVFVGLDGLVSLEELSSSFVSAVDRASLCDHKCLVRDGALKVATPPWLNEDRLVHASGESGSLGSGDSRRLRTGFEFFEDSDLNLEPSFVEFSPLRIPDASLEISDITASTGIA